MSGPLILIPIVVILFYVILMVVKTRRRKLEQTSTQRSGSANRQPKRERSELEELSQMIEELDLSPDVDESLKNVLHALARKITDMDRRLSRLEKIEARAEAKRQMAEHP